MTTGFMSWSLLIGYLALGIVLFLVVFAVTGFRTRVFTPKYLPGAIMWIVLWPLWAIVLILHAADLI